MLFQGTLVQFPASTQQVTVVYRFSARGSDKLFWLPELLYASGTQIHIQAKYPHTKNNKIFKKLKKTKYPNKKIPSQARHYLVLVKNNCK